MNLTEKIISRHLIEGEMKPGAEIALRIDQTLTQDATGTMAYLQLEAMGISRVKTDLSVSYVDHNTLQMGFRNADDHRYLRTVAAKYGIIFSPPGTGICHQLHLESFAKPGATLIGSDSHTPTAGGIGSMAFGAGGLSVALAMGGAPYIIAMPKVVKVWLTKSLQGWASAKDIILYLLAKLTVKGGVGKVFEYCGPGVASLSVTDRATITNMGAELGATTSIFPSDQRTKEFLAKMGREADWQELQADPGASYDEEVEIDLSQIVPMAAQPHMPDRGVPVADLAGLAVDQVAIGSCTNSSYADLELVASVLKNKRVNPATDVMISPGSKRVLVMLTEDANLRTLSDAGARLLECSCGPCIGMGGSPVSGGVSVRTFNRNFEGRSGTKDAQVYLTSPEVAAQVALNGKFTNPATWGPAPKRKEFPAQVPNIDALFVYPPENGSEVEVLRGPNIVPIKPFDPLPAKLEAEVVIHLGDNITTDHILPAGPEITSLRSNVPAISRYIFGRVDEGFVSRAENAGRGVVVAGENYGQGSSREHAALGPRHLGIRAIVAKSLARIHRDNLVNFGILPLTFVNVADYDKMQPGVRITLDTNKLVAGEKITLEVGGEQVTLANDLTPDELEIIRSGGMLSYIGKK